MGLGCDKHAFDLLWAPWRMEYIVRSDRPSECVFCAAGSSESDVENHVLRRYETCFALLNRFPYNNGHILVAPYEHVAELDRLGDEQLLEIMKLLCECKKALSAAMSPDGFNVGLNQGSASGAGIEGHLHFHIVPRWQGDTNFMTVTGQTKVIPQSLDEAYEALHGAMSGEKG